MIHYQNYTNEISSHELFLGYPSISYLKILYIRSDVGQFPSEVAKKISFEEHITDISNNRL
jgi:hypothetical protein